VNNELEMKWSGPELRYSLSVISMKELRKTVKTSVRKAYLPAKI
jgi:hypothetical protein